MSYVILGSKFQRGGPTWGSQSDLNHVCMGAGVELCSSYCNIEILMSDFLFILLPEPYSCQIPLGKIILRLLKKMATSAASQILD